MAQYRKSSLCRPFEAKRIKTAYLTLTRYDEQPYNIYIVVTPSPGQTTFTMWLT